MLRAVRSEAMRFSGRKTGFTLVEILVVIVILAVAVSVLVPNLDQNRGRELGIAAEQLAALTNHAQQEAVFSTSVWRLEIDPARRQYLFTRSEAGDFEPISGAPFSHPRRLGDIALQALSINEEPVSGIGEIFFQPSGERDSFAVELKDGEHRQWVVLPPYGAAYVSVSHDDNG